MMKKTILLLTVISLLVVCAGCRAKTYDENLAESSAAYDQLIDGFKERYGDQYIEDPLLSDFQDYPPYYHMAYPDDDGKLVVVVYDDSREIVREIRELAGKRDITVRLREESDPDEVYREMKRIREYKGNNKAPFPWGHIGENIRLNCVVVVVAADRMEFEMIRWFRENVSDSDMVRMIAYTVIQELV
ncbi:MAG: hypothetical protein ACOX88_10575 [Christensenellales bacterium]|jgi:hypothetical protein